MDTAYGIDGGNRHGTPAHEQGGVSDVTVEVGGDERRMHVRAYNHWVSLLRGRAYPAIEDLDPNSIADFGPHSVLLDFSGGIEDPKIQFLGRTLREECGVEVGITRMADVPSRSLLSRLTDHYLQIIANRAPIGFEAEFVGQRGYNTLYRGILMPFSSDEDTIDFIYGVINWKEMVDAETQAKLTAEVAAARRFEPSTATAPIWADGPSAGLTEDATEEAAAIGDDGDVTDDGSLADSLARARSSAEAVAAADSRSRSALYRALARAYAFARATQNDPEGYAELLEDAGIKAQTRAPMTPIVKLVFGVGYDKTRLTEFAAVLSHAARNDVAPTAMHDFLDSFAGGIKGVVAAERALRRPTTKADGFATIAKTLRERPPLARVDIAHSGKGEFVVLLARKTAGDTLDVVACLDHEPLTASVVRRAA